MDKQARIKYVLEAAEWGYRSSVDVEATPIAGSVVITVQGDHVALLEGHQADAFLDEAKFLWEELEEIALDWVYLALAKPYVENSI
jgi:hypothetical protein